MGKLRKRFTIQHYNIGIVSMDAVEKGLPPGTVKWMEHKYSDRFFADPFLWYMDDDNYYILAEEMCFKNENGIIVLLTVSKNSFSLKQRKVIISEPFHLSFPYCEYNSDEVIPEAGSSSRCTKYTLSRNTHEVLTKSVISSYGIIDPVYYNTDKGESILGSSPEEPSSTLYKYSFTGCTYQRQDTPLIVGRSGSRNAGRIFSLRNAIIRPVQDCSLRYGGSVKLMEICASSEGYKEKELISVSSANNPPYNETLHTFNKYGDFVIIDGSLDVYSIANYYYKLCKYIKRVIHNFNDRK